MEHTNHRGHAIEIGRDATRDGVDVVIVHGGDGTVNEVVNGMLGEAGRAPPRWTAPAVGVVPGGSANVFARSLGHQPRSRSRPRTSSSTCSARNRNGTPWRRSA